MLNPGPEHGFDESETAAQVKTVKIVTGRDEVGPDVFGFLVKRSYRFTPGGVRRDQRRAFLRVDIYWGDPSTQPAFRGRTAALQAGDRRRGLGHVHAPHGPPVASVLMRHRNRDRSGAQGDCRVWRPGRICGRRRIRLRYSRPGALH